MRREIDLQQKTISRLIRENESLHLRLQSERSVSEKHAENILEEALAIIENARNPRLLPCVGGKLVLLFPSCVPSTGFDPESLILEESIDSTVYLCTVWIQSLIDLDLNLLNL